MPAYASAQVTFGVNFVNTILAALKTVPTAALIVAGKIRLITNPAYNPTSTDTIAGNAASEANYSGYAAGGIAVSLSAPVNLSIACQGVLSTALFEATAVTPFVPAVVHGYWVDDGTNVILGERFGGGSTFQFASPGDFLQLILQLPVQLNQLTS